MLNNIQTFIYNHMTLIWTGILLSPLWSVLETHSTNFATSTPFALITCLWALDVLSRWLCKYYDPHERIDIQKSQNSFINLLIWWIVMGVCYLIRIEGGFMVSLPVESISILILGASVLKNVCSCSDNPMLQKIGDQFTRNVEDKVNAMTTVVKVEQAPSVITVTQSPVIPTTSTVLVNSEPQAAHEGDKV